jgi:Tol biopolymer transport system component/DNA-binding winged helix-turn-helix (wHTH) protein
MEKVDHSAQIVRFGVFEANLGSGELHKHGVKVPLPGQPFQVLAILLERSGELVTREELRRQVWRDDTFVDFEQALNTAIAKIRHALGDDADNPRFVETLPRRGYRFIAPVGKPVSQARAPKRRFARLSPKWILLTIGLTAIVLLASFGLWHIRREIPLTAASPLEIVPLTALAGDQRSPTFSPDGSRVAFSNYDGNNSGIYIAMIGGEKPLRLTDFGLAPAWSPDGRQVAFVRRKGEKELSAIYVVPALGGTPRQLYTGYIDATFIESLSWSPDGESLAFAQREPDNIHAWIALLSLADNSTRPLTSSSPQDHDFIPAFSPDGRSVAFARGSNSGVANDLFVIPAKGGEAKRLTFDNRAIFGLTWTPNSRELVFSSARGGIPILWRVPISGGTPQPFAGISTVAWFPTISPKGNQLAFRNSARHDTVWRLDLADEKQRRGPPQCVIATKGLNWRPDVSPDGSKIAFESIQTGLGLSEIWTCNSDGSNCAQVTSLHGTAGTARWSPDGRYIAFEFRPKERSEVYLVDLNGGTPRVLSTLPGADNLAPNWSGDGQWIYFTSNSGGGPFQLWKVRATGGAPVQVTKNGGVYGIESADARSLYYAKYEVPGIWKMSLPGGKETRVLDRSGGEDWSNWALTPNGIYFIASDAHNQATIEYFEFATHRIVRILSMDRPSSVGLAVAPHGRSILYVEKEFSESNIMLVKNLP